MNLRHLEQNQSKDGESVCKHENLILKKTSRVGKHVVHDYVCKDCDKPVRKKTESDEERNIFKAMRNIDCDHDWQRDGHDSHYDYYKCSKCDEETKV